MVVIFKLQECQNLLNEYETLSKLITYRGDKLAVKKGVLEISEGGFLQAPKRTIKNLKEGGYNRESVTQHLEKLAQDTDTFIKKLFSHPSNITDSAMEAKQFSKAVKEAASKISDIQFSYRSMWGGSSSPICQRLSKLYTQFSNSQTTLKLHLKTLDKSLFVKQPLIIDFDAPVDLKRIKFKMPKGMTPADVVHLAESAEKQKVPLWKKIACYALAIFSLPVVLVPLLPLSCVKLLVWNPIEFIIKGEVTTKLPLDWWIGNLASWLTVKTHDVTEVALERYAGQLINTQVLTQDRVNAYCKLVKHVKEVDLGSFRIGSNDLNELLSYITPFNFGPGALDALKEILKGLDKELLDPSNFRFFLLNHQNDLNWIDDPAGFTPNDITQDVQEKFGVSTLDERIKCAVKSLSLDKFLDNKDLISVTQVKQIVEAVGKTSKCRKIQIPSGSEKIPEVLNELKKSGFKQNPHSKGVFIR